MNSERVVVKLTRVPASDRVMWMVEIFNESGKRIARHAFPPRLAAAFVCPAQAAA